jgi:CheY-like chemotaxis protein
MPGMDGLEFLAALRDHPHASEFSVLVMSAHSGPTGAEDCPGVVGTLMKPFELSELLFWVKSRC